MEDIVAIGGFFTTVIVGLMIFGPFGRAVAASITRKSLASAGAEVAERVDELAARVESLQQQVAELAERQDFTERLVAKGRERGAIGSGDQR